MKDKKSIAIVMLAAITAAVGIFSFVSNQTKLKAYSKLKADRDSIYVERYEFRKQRDEYLTQRDQLEAQTQTLKTQTQTLKENVVTQGGRIEELGVGLETLKLGVEEKILEIETLKLQHAQDLGKAESKFQETAIALVNIEEELNKKTSELEGFKGKSEERKKLITALEVKNDSLNQEKGALEVKIATLNTEINETSQKLEDSEGDRGFLEGELLRLQEEKSKLVKQMNDVEFLTAQYRRIKSDIAVAKRLDWMRRGIGIYAKPQTITEKHAALRKGGANGAVMTADTENNENVSVELTSDGRVIINGDVIETAPDALEIEPIVPVP